jgi:hypothetical protein
METVEKEPGLQGGCKPGLQEWRPGASERRRGRDKAVLAALHDPHRADRCAVSVALLEVAIELLQAPAGFVHENPLKRGRGVIVAGGVFSAVSRIGMAREQKRCPGKTPSASMLIIYPNTCLPAGR